MGPGHDAPDQLEGKEAAAQGLGGVRVFFGLIGLLVMILGIAVTRGALP